MLRTCLSLYDDGDDDDDDDDDDEDDTDDDKYERSHLLIVLSKWMGDDCSAAWFSGKIYTKILKKISLKPSKSSFS